MGTERRRQRDRQPRVDGILAAAKAVFLSKGFSGATMNDIADAAGLSRRTIYHYFRSKEELSIAAAAATLKALLSRVESLGDAVGSGLDRLKLTFDLYRRMYRDNPGDFQFILNFPECARILGTDGAAAMDCLESVRRIVGAVAGYAREGMEDGSVRRMDDPDNVAATLVSLVHGAVQNAVTDRDAVRLATGQGTEDFLDGIFTVMDSHLRATAAR